MTSRLEVLKHSGYLLFARLFARLSSVPFLIYVAATLGPSLFGLFSFVLATVEMISSLGDLGLSRYGARAMVRMKGGRDRLAGIILTFQIGTSAVLSVLALVLVLVFPLEQPKEDVALLGIAGIFFSAFIFTTETLFTGAKRFGASAVLAVIGRSVYLIAGFAVLAVGYSVVALMAAYAVSLAVESLLRLTYTMTSVTSFSFRFSAQEFGKVVRGTLPFAVTGIATLFFYRADMVIMGVIRGDTDVGIYSAAYSFFSFFVWLPIVLSRALLPGVTARYSEDPPAAEQVCWFWYRVAGIVGIPIAFVVTMMARFAIETLMPAFGQSILTLQILIWAIPPLMMVSIGFIALTATDRENAGARTTVITAILIVVLDIILIRFFGPLGAAVAMVAATTLWIAQMHLLLKKEVFAPHHGVLLTFALPVSGGAVMALVALVTVSSGTIIALPAGLAAYGAVVAAGQWFERRLGRNLINAGQG